MRRIRSPWLGAQYQATQTPVPLVVAAWGTGATSAADTTTHSITMPSGVTAGVDLIGVIFSVDENPTVSISSGTGWTKMGQASNSTIVTGAIFWKIADGSDTLTLLTSTSQQSSHITFRVPYARGLTGKSSNGSSTNSDPASATHPDGISDYMWIATRSGDSTVVATVAPSGYGTLQTSTAAGTSGASTNAAALFIQDVATKDPGTFTSATEQWVCWNLIVSLGAVEAGQFYISNAGNDSNDGTYASPHLTVNATNWAALLAGQTMLVVNDLTPATFYDADNAIRLDTGGSSGSPKTLKGMGGVRRIIDLTNANFVNSFGYGLRLGGNYTNVELIHIKNIHGTTGDDFTFAFNPRGTNINITNCEASYIEGIGLCWDGSTSTPNNLLIYRSDFHHCFDPGTSGAAYQNGDGIQLGNNTTTATGIIVRECRCWSNADDGIDLFFTTETATIEDSWWFRNGFREDGTTAGGDGNGIKLGSSSNPAPHICRRNLIWDNRRAAIDPNGNTNACDISYNTSINNGRASSPDPGSFYAYDNGVAHTLTGNVKYGGYPNVTNGSLVVESYNSWNNPPNIGAESSGWFQSLSDTGADGPRGPNGELPTLTFGKPTVGGALDGTGPGGVDLGCFTV